MNFGGVDFVDLRPTNNILTQPTAPPLIEAEATNQPAPAIPAFTSGDSLVVAMDPTVVPTNSYLTLTVESPGTPTTGGTLYFGSNPTVVTIPLSVGAASASGFMLNIGTWSTALGQSNSTQYFITPNQ
jgi:hypothetical protein